jgi:hypothetical protein
LRPPLRFILPGAVLACVHAAAGAQTPPVPAATLPPSQVAPVPSAGQAAPPVLAAPDPDAPAPHAKPQGIYATIDVGAAEARIRQLGQLIPYPRREAIAAAVANAPRLSPPVLYALANAIALDDANMPNAVFWYHVARLRAVYDALRCRDASARPVIAAYGKRLNPDVARYQRQNRQHTLQIAELAIKWDRENPRNYDHRWINLHGKVARFSDGKDPTELTVPESEWPAILQHVHEAHLKSVREFAEGKAK